MGLLLAGLNVFKARKLLQLAPYESASVDSGQGHSAVQVFGQDLTERARLGTLDPVVGRDAELEHLVHILSRRTKNNPVLLGAPGVGKTAIVEGLALRIATQDVPPEIAHTRIVTLDLGLMVAGSQHQGAFEARLKALMREVADSPHIILFIDELHTLLGAGGSPGGVSAANLIKAALARGEFRCIGATTLDEYRTSIESDGALARRFQPILVEPPSLETSVAMLQGLKGRYAAHHHVHIPDTTVAHAVKLAARYLPDHALPDTAVDVLDEASVLASLRHHRPRRDGVLPPRDNSVGEDDVAAVVSRMTRIPLTRIAAAESRQLLSLSTDLHQRVVGQDDAVEAVSRAMRRSRVGLRDLRRPIGTFLFLGPTGVGKTELARALAAQLFGDDDALIRLDMSEYMERLSVSRLVGAPPGYVGYDEGGQLTEPVRRNPYAVVLLDEIEKAHPDVLNLLLQVMDEGHLTDSTGRKVNFKNVVLIMTSNVASEDLANATSMGFQANPVSQTAATPHARVFQEVKRAFAPEFLNRIDDLVLFHPLQPHHLSQILGQMLAQVQTHITEQSGITVDIDLDALTWLAQQGSDPAYGARPLRRAIRRYVEDPLAEAILRGDCHPGDTVHIQCADDGLTLVPHPHVAAFELSCVR